MSQYVPAAPQYQRQAWTLADAFEIYPWEVIPVAGGTPHRFSEGSRIQRYEAVGTHHFDGTPVQSRDPVSVQRFGETRIRRYE